MKTHQERPSIEENSGDGGDSMVPDLALDQPSTRNQRIKKRLFLFIKLAVSTLLIGVLLYRIEWRALWDAFIDISVIYFILSFGAVILLEWVTAGRLRILMRPTAVRVPILKILKISFIGRFYGLFLPSGVGYNLVRWYKMTKDPEGRVQFFLVVLLEQSLNVFLMLGCVAFPLWFSVNPEIAHLREALLTTSMVLFFSIAVFYLFFVVHPFCVLFHKWEAFFAPIRNRLFPKGAIKSLDFSMYCGRTLDFLGALLVSCLAQGAILLRIMFLFLAVGIDLPWITVLWIGSLIVFLQSLPVSVAGIGIRESAFAYCLSLYGMAYELGALVGLLFFTQMILGALLGGLFEMTDRGRHDTHASEAARASRAEPYESSVLKEV